VLLHFKYEKSSLFSLSKLVFLVVSKYKNRRNEGRMVKEKIEKDLLFIYTRNYDVQPYYKEYERNAYQKHHDENKC